MSNEIETLFNCKGCFRKMVVQEYLFEKVYKGQELCVKCRIKKEKRNATKLESIALLGEDSIDKVIYKDNV